MSGNIKNKEDLNDFNIFTVTRNDLISLLEKWEKAEVTTVQVYDEANRLYGNSNALDWEDGGISITMDVLQDLESLDINFITQEDIRAYKELLLTPLGNAAKGFKKLYEYKETIDRKKRIETLSGKYPYIKLNKGEYNGTQKLDC